MKRREFITLLGGAAAVWPMVARAQQAAPVIGYLDNRSSEATVERLRAFHRGLKESGYVEGENLTIVYRWAEGDNSRLAGLAADLVNRRVAVIVSTGGRAFDFGSDGGDRDNPDRVHSSGGPGQDGAGFKSCSSKPKSD
jgi:putative ABC transport system substrate-binding protein